MSVDLHTHTTHSDGTVSPGDLIKLAKQKNLTAIAITDHDITSANREALSCGQASGIEVVPGVELSVDHRLPQGGHLHILGLFIDPQNTPLNQTLQRVRDERDKRNKKILSRFQQLGFNISYEDILVKAGEGTVGRPHFASVMVEKGIVNSISQAFDRYLKHGALAYVDRWRLPADQAINLIQQSGGISILAHPITLGFSSFTHLGRHILELKSIGLDGIEVYCSGFSQDLTRKLVSFANENDMVLSGGSDFHGTVKPEQDLGSVEVPDEVYWDLVSYWESKGE